MTVRQRGPMPKAYLRIDPNIDQTHPDFLDGFVRLLCAANRQPIRGVFRDRHVLDSIFGKTSTDRFYQRRDVRDGPDGSVEVLGWTTWQEGDMTVAERMSRYRQRKSGVTDGVTNGVADTVTEPSPNRIPLSDTLGRKDLGTSSTGLPTPDRAVGAPTSEATRLRNKPIGSWTPIGLVDWGSTLDKRQLEAWATFGHDWDAFKAAWLGRGLKYPPRGTAEDDPNAGNPSQRALLWSILDTRPDDLAEWVSESPKGSVTGVISHVLERWHSVRDEAGRESA